MDEGHAGQDSPRRKALRWAKRGAWALLACALAFLALVPTGRYLARAGFEESKILLRRKSIQRMVADTMVQRSTRAKLQVVLDARAFAQEQLGLDAGKSFTTYSALDRDTLVLVLSAAYRDRLAFYRWWFPIVGRVPYKGYFNFTAARAAEGEFKDNGFDTMLRPAPAFSTLGWFNDPLVSTSLRADSLSLANTVIHELTHNTFYASGQAEFNESFANFVGARGSAEFFRRRGASAVVDEAQARWSDEKILAAFWHGLYRDIDSVFTAHPGDSARRERLVLRDSVYRSAKAYLVFKLAPMLRTVSPRYLERLKLDNAAVLSGRIYLTDLELFDSVYVREGSDTRRTLERVIALAKADQRDPFGALRRSLAAKAGRRP